MAEILKFSRNAPDAREAEAAILSRSCDELQAQARQLTEILARLQATAVGGDARQLERSLDRLSREAAHSRAILGEAEQLMRWIEQGDLAACARYLAARADSAD